MAELNAKVRKWGDSLAVIIPKETADTEKISASDNVRIKIVKQTDLSDVFGLLKGKLKKSAQQLKDESRKGWS